MAFFSTYQSDVDDELEVSYRPGHPCNSGPGYQPAFVSIELPDSRGRGAHVSMVVDEARRLIVALESTVMAHDAAQRLAAESGSAA